MNFGKELLKLNAIKREKDEHVALPCFISGDYKTEFKKLINTVAPYGKVGFITFAASHEKYGKDVVESVRRAGAKVVSLIMPDKCIDSVDYAGLLFNLPEDVRIVFTFDGELCRVCDYYASVRNCAYVYIPVSVENFGAVSGTLYLKNGEKTDKIISRADKYVIADETIIDFGAVSAAYAHVVSKAVALIDYRVYALAKKENVHKTAYALMLKCVKDGLTIFELSPKDRAKLMFIDSYVVEIANAFTEGKFSDFSSESFAARIMRNSCNYGDAELAAALKILQIYAESFSIKKAKPTVPDYNTRAEKVAELIKFGEDSVISSFISQTQDYSRNQDSYISILNSLSAEAKKLYASSKKFRSIYLGLGGKRDFCANEALLKEAVGFSGDVPFNFNGMTALRDLGDLEDAVELAFFVPTVVSKADKKAAKAAKSAKADKTKKV